MSALIYSTIMLAALSALYLAAHIYERRSRR